jgi:hypothetical protein
MRERDIERYLKKEVEKRGGLCLKFTSSEVGVPDRIVVYRARLIFVEVKTPTGHVAAMQTYQIARLKKAGAEVSIVRSASDVDLLVDTLE